MPVSDECPFEICFEQLFSKPCFLRSWPVCHKKRDMLLMLGYKLKFVFTHVKGGKNAVDKINHDCCASARIRRRNYAYPCCGRLSRMFPLLVRRIRRWLLSSVLWIFRLRIWLRVWLRLCSCEYCSPQSEIRKAQERSQNQVNRYGQGTSKGHPLFHSPFEQPTN